MLTLDIRAKVVVFVFIGDIMTKYEELKDILENIGVPFDYKNICDKAKEMLLNYSFIGDDLIDYYDYFAELDKCTSPIEQIFYIAYIIYCKHFTDIKINNIELSVILLEEISLQKIEKIEDNKFNIDFVIDFSAQIKDGEFIYPRLKNLKYAIELDGFDYHSNKQQMNYDYERENKLKSKGYNVVRFTGSQIYKTPYNCIYNLIKIIINDIKREIKKYE